MKFLDLYIECSDPSTKVLLFLGDPKKTAVHSYASEIGIRNKEDNFPYEY